MYSTSSCDYAFGDMAVLMVGYVDYYWPRDRSNFSRFKNRIERGQERVVRGPALKNDEFPVSLKCKQELQARSNDQVPEKMINR